MIPTRQRSPRLASALSALTLLLALAACGSNEEQPDEPPSASDAQEQGLPEGPGFDGAAGEVVALDGTQAQVRNDQTGQVAVSWTDSTTFTTTVAATLADVTVGDCIVVDGGTEESGGAATSISVTRPVDGTCVAGGFSAGMPDLPEGGGDFELPEGAPTDLPEGAGERPDFAAVVIGEVTAVEGSTLTVAGLTPTGEGEEQSQEQSVTTGADTRITTVVDADASAMAIGVCVTATGSTDDVGAVTAESVAVSSPVDGECRSGMGPGRGGPQGGGPS